MLRVALFFAIMVFLGGCFLYNENYNAGQAALKSGNIAVAKEQFRIGCDTGGDKYSCHNYFYLAYQDKNYEQAIPYAKKACDLRNYKGCGALGHMYEMGEGLEQNYSEASVYYEKACKNGLYESCERAARLYSEGLGVPKNLIKAQTLLESSCTGYSGNANKCYEFGTSYLNGGDTLKARNFFERACDMRHWQGCSYAAALYLEQTPKDYFKISSFYDKACKANDKTSCYNLGVLYAEKRNPIANPQEAKAFFDKACTYSSEELCYKIALLYTDKRNGMYNMQEAKYYFQKACGFGSKDGCSAASKIR
jgi:TPR repeat protein